MDQFKVSDKVWCLMFGEGVVVSVADDGRDYPVMVRVGCQSHTYSQSGVLLDGGKRSLFFSEPKVDAATERPFVPTLIGKKVVVTEPACYNAIITVKWETEDQFGCKDFTFRKENVAIYEISSENLLKP